MSVRHWGGQRRRSGHNPGLQPTHSFDRTPRGGGFIRRCKTELHGKLAIAVKIGYGRKTRHFFRVFKLVGEHTWAEVTNLRDHTLFLGPACCKAVHMSTAGRRGAVEGNRIYYFDQDSYNPDEVECLERLDIGSCTMHCCKSEGRHHLERILSRRYQNSEYHYGKDQIDSCMWLWPPDF
jgi:hypothetical protein